MSEKVLLKPCPFCGRPGTLIRRKNAPEDGVTCTNVDCYGEAPDVAAWNTRPGVGVDSLETIARVIYRKRQERRYDLRGWDKNNIPKWEDAPQDFREIATEIAQAVLEALAARIEKGK